MTAAAPSHSATATIVPGVALSTVGRWGFVEQLIDSLQASTMPVPAIAIANQGGGVVPAFVANAAGVEVVASGGGASAGRNDAYRLLDGAATLIAFPNDHSRFRPDTWATAGAAMSRWGSPAVLAGTLMEPDGPRFALPPSGTSLGRWRVWRVIEPAMFLTPTVARMGFRQSLSPGNASPWQAGEGTDLLLRALQSGLRVVAAPEIVVDGGGERRTLTPAEESVKLRSYARGMGQVLQLNHAGPVETAFHVLSPLWWIVAPTASGRRTPAPRAFTAVVGRAEGRLGRCLPARQDRLDPSALAK